MHKLISAIVIPAVCLTLAADSTGRINGKVTTKDGKPVPGVTVTLTRSDITWVKDLKVTDKGTFMQVGLEPKEFKFTISAPGYQTYNEDIKIPLGESLVKNITLLTVQEAALAAGASATPPPDAKAVTGTVAFNSGVEFYNQQKFAEALPFLEKAAKDLNEGIVGMPEGEAKTAMVNQIPVVERVYGITLYEVGKADETQAALKTKAEPYLVAAFDRNPKDQRVIVPLLVLAQARKDAAATKKYQDALDAVVGPRPEVAYNDGVVAYKAEKFQEAKDDVTRAIGLNPKFADAYYLLGMADVNLSDLKGAREAFKKYIEIAPAGKHAGEVKDVLKELK